MTDRSCERESIVRLVISTRRSRESFLSECAIGKAYRAYRSQNVELRLFCENFQVGLPTIYNTAIAEAREKPALLVFLHDDVFLPDYYWADRIREGLQCFDILGVAGSAPRQPLQPAWHLKATDKSFVTREEGLSGSVAHDTEILPKRVDFFGPTRLRVDILDGLLLAASSETLLRHNLRFDERFRFHLYDVDFCREAEGRSLKCGTWDIATIHSSRGNYDRNWLLAVQSYFEKWNENYGHLEIFRSLR